VSTPAGWYPQPDGRQRYWDGESWTEHFAPGVPAATSALPLLRQDQVTASSGRRFGVADSFGWGGLALVLLLGALTSGFSGAAIMLGLYVLVVGVIALARGRVGWARLGSRAAGAAALGTALVLITVGAIAAPPSKPAPVTVVAPTPSPTTSATPSPDLSATPAATTVVPPVATPTPTIDPVAIAVAQARSGTALAAVALLAVKGRAPKTGYTRDQFGQSWFDTDRNGCDTRNDILRRDLVGTQMKNACKVLAGALADPYTGMSIRFVYAGASEVDIDHVVALSDAWQKGAAMWPAGKRLALANDPLNLMAVDASTNRSKGDGDTATWLPPNKSYRCTYVAKQVAVKGKYGLWVTAAERDAMTRVLATCPTMGLPLPGSAPTIALLPRTAPQPAPAPVQPAPRPAPVQPVPVPVPAPRPAPAPAPKPAPVPGVHPGAFCSPQGGLGYTVKGTLMRCSTKAGDSRARWRAA
jgi:hypothetical protein